MVSEDISELALGDITLISSLFSLKFSSGGDVFFIDDNGKDLAWIKLEKIGAASTSPSVLAR